MQYNKEIQYYPKSGIVDISLYINELLKPYKKN